MSVLKRLEEISEIRPRTIEEVFSALPDLLRVVRAAEYGLEYDDGSTPWWDDLRAALEALTKEEPE